MEKNTLTKLKKLSLNQYLVVKLEKGDVLRSITRSRAIGYWTLGLSMVFTSPYVVVKGERTTENIRCLTRLIYGLPCTVKDNLK